MWTRGILRQAPDIVIMDVQPKKAESRAGPQKSLFAVLTKEIPHRARSAALTTSILPQFWKENFDSAYPMLDLTNMLLNGREAAV